MQNYIDKNKVQVLDDFLKMQSHNTLECEQYKSLILVRCIGDLEV